MTIVNSCHIDYQTQAAGTVITDLVPPLLRSPTDHTINVSVRTRLTTLSYTAGATAHDLVLMRALAEVQTTAAAAASATSIVVSSASFVGDTIASGDYLVVQHGDGTFGLYLASALATLTVTINALAKAVNSGAPVWIMGSPTANSAYHQTLKSIASTKVDYVDAASGFACSGFDVGTYYMTGKGEPLVIYSSNATAAGTLNWANALYSRE